MYPKTSVFVATSLDGFIARLDGSIDWLEAANKAVPEGEDCGFSRFFATIDLLVMGRHTFEQVKAFGDWPYGRTPVLVLTRRHVDIPPALAGFVKSSNETPTELMQRMAMRGTRQVYVEGGLTVQTFIAAGLIDELTVTTIPILLGRGRPLFGQLTRDLQLEHQHTHAYPFGFVQSTYKVVNNDA
jgi:dihydrofolate reductase